MRQGNRWAAVFAGLAVAAGLYAQAPADPSKQTPAAPPAAGQSSSNPFPEDTATVPVMPSKTTPVLPAAAYNGAESAPLPAPGDEADPARSPEDPRPEPVDNAQESSSSSFAGIDKLMPVPDSELPQKKKGKPAKEESKGEVASKDIEVGSYYLERKNWKAALSRFESAMVLDPENPEVYWGMAEAEQRLGDFGAAKAHYLKVLDYDPDSRYGKDARKALKDPALANAPDPKPGQVPGEGPK